MWQHDVMLMTVGQRTPSNHDNCLKSRSRSCSASMTSSKMMTTVGFVLLASGISGVAGAAPAAGDPPSPPKVPAALAVPAGAKVVARFHATGAQVYACTSAAGLYSWLLSRPDATLADASGAVVGTHGAGPSWKSKDGSSVVGKKLAQAAAPDAGAVPDRKSVV